MGAIISRRIDHAVSEGQRVAFKEKYEAIEQMVAVPLVVTTTVPVADAMAAVDAVIGAQKQLPGWAIARYEVERSHDRITYAVGSKRLPQDLVAEVRFGEGDGTTQISVRTLGLAERDGIYVAAGALASLREAVTYAADAAGDADKIAEGRRLYAPPELGTPRYVLAKRQQTVRYAAGALGVFALLGPILGIELGALMQIGLLLVAAAVAFLSARIGRALMGPIDQSSLPETVPLALPKVDWTSLKASTLDRLPTKLRTPKAMIVAAVAVIVVIVAISMSSQARDRAEYEFASDAPEISEGFSEPAASEVPIEEFEPEEPTDDTSRLVNYVVEQGGTTTLDALADPDSDQWEPAFKFMTAAEPFYEWVVPVSEGVSCSLGDRSVEAGELYAYVGQQESVLVRIVADGNSITSLHVQPAVGEDGQEVLRSNRAMQVADLLAEAPSDGSDLETEGAFWSEGSSVDESSVWFEIRKDTYIQPVAGDVSEFGDCYIDGVQVTQAEFLQTILASRSTRGGVSCNNQRITRSWLFIE